MFGGGELAAVVVAVGPVGAIGLGGARAALEGIEQVIAAIHRPGTGEGMSDGDGGLGGGSARMGFPGVGIWREPEMDEEQQPEGDAEASCR
ncbi:hypothetical protein LBMAG56_48800 [Verrucomicrobiota bacterium]|nr:hypothetical protein LBMAG56_48800 [Verrucomicrobiota bacterium]